MKGSQFYALVATMYVAPHMHSWVAVGAFVVFAVLGGIAWIGERR